MLNNTFTSNQITQRVTCPEKLALFEKNAEAKKALQNKLIDIERDINNVDYDKCAALLNENFSPLLNKAFFTFAQLSEINSACRNELFTEAGLNAIDKGIFENDMHYVIDAIEPLLLRELLTENGINALRNRKITLYDATLIETPYLLKLFLDKKDQLDDPEAIAAITKNGDFAKSLLSRIIHFNFQDFVKNDFSIFLFKMNKTGLVMLSQIEHFFKTSTSYNKNHSIFFNDVWRSFFTKYRADEIQQLLKTYLTADEIITTILKLTEVTESVEAWRASGQKPACIAILTDHYDLLSGKTVLETLFKDQGSVNKATEQELLHLIQVTQHALKHNTLTSQQQPSLLNWLKKNIRINSQIVFASLSPENAAYILNRNDLSVDFYQNLIESPYINPIIENIFDQSSPENSLSLFKKFKDNLSLPSHMEKNPKFKAFLIQNMVKIAVHNNSKEELVAIFIDDKWHQNIIDLFLKQLKNSNPEENSNIYIILFLLKKLICTDQNHEQGNENENITVFFNLIASDYELYNWYKEITFKQKVDFFFYLFNFYITLSEGEIEQVIIESIVFHLQILSPTLAEITENQSSFEENIYNLQKLFSLLLKLFDNKKVILLTDEFNAHLIGAFESLIAKKIDIFQVFSSEEEKNNFIENILPYPALCKFFIPVFADSLKDKHIQTLQQKLHVALDSQTKDYDYALFLISLGISLPCARETNNTAIDNDNHSVRKNYTDYLLNLLMDATSFRENRNGVLMGHLITNGAETHFCINYNENERYSRKEQVWRKRHAGYSLLHFAIRYNDVVLFNILKKEGIIARLKEKMFMYRHLELAQFTKQYAKENPWIMSEMIESPINYSSTPGRPRMFDVPHREDPLVISCEDDMDSFPASTTGFR